MPSGNKLNGRAVGMPEGLAIGILWAIGWTALSVMVIGLLITKEIIKFEWIGYCIVFILISAPFIGSKIAYRKIKCKRLPVSTYTAAIYFVVLLGLNALCFGGRFEAVGVTLMCVCSGAFLSVLIDGAGKSRSTNRVYKKRHT